MGFFGQSGRREKSSTAQNSLPGVNHMSELLATELCPVAIATQGGRNLFSLSLPFGPSSPRITEQHIFPIAHEVQPSNF